MIRTQRFVMAIAVAAAVVVVGVVASCIPDTSKLRFAERMVAGTSDDLMIVRHVRLEGTNEETGARLAQIAHDRHGSKGDSAPGTLANDQLTWAKANWPEMAGRAAGVSAYF